MQDRVVSPRGPQRDPRRRAANIRVLVVLALVALVIYLMAVMGMR